MTKHSVLFFVALAAVAGGAALCLRPAEHTGAEAAVMTPASRRVAAAAPLATPSSPVVSPFGPGAPAAADTAARQQQRRQKMAALGYPTPPEYDKMPLKSLYQLAEKGDVFAMIQLGEQYSYEHQALASDPDFQRSLPPVQTGTQYFQDAALAGHVHVALIVANQYAGTNQPDEAYAWARLAQTLGDRGAAQPAQQLLGSLTAAQLKSANARYDTLFFRATARFH